MKYIELVKKRDITSIKLRNTGSCIIMSVKNYTMPYNGIRVVSNRFYFTKTELHKILNDEIGNNIHCNDMHSYCTISTQKTLTTKIINFNFSWLNGAGDGLHLKGTNQNISLNFQEIREFVVYSKEDSEIQLIEYKESNRCKVLFAAGYKSKSNIDNIIKDKIIKQKFVKFIMQRYLQNEHYSRVIYSNDSYNKYSFYFQMYRNDTYISNGGLIYHANSETRKTIYKHGKAFKDVTIKGYYGIHT